MTTEQYIEHEVKLRVQDQRFQQLEETVQEVRYLMRAFFGTAITAIILPIIMHHYGFI